MLNRPQRCSDGVRRAGRSFWFAFAILACRQHDGVVLEEAGYSVRMPGPATLHEEKSELGHVRLHTVKAGQQAFTAGYGDNLGVDVTPDEMLDAVQSGYVGSDRLVRQEDIALQGHPGREVHIAGRGLTRVVRLYCVGRRTYHLTVVSKDADVLPSARTEFLDSFRLTDTGRSSGS